MGDEGIGRQGMIAKGYEVTLRGDENVLKLTVMMVTHICENTKTH